VDTAATEKTAAMELEKELAGRAETAKTPETVAMPLARSSTRAPVAGEQSVVKVAPVARSGMEETLMARMETRPATTAITAPRIDGKLLGTVPDMPIRPKSPLRTEV
jgi:hypothetical protein